MTDLPALIRQHGLDASGPVLDLARAAYAAGAADARPRPGRRLYGRTDAELATLERIWAEHTAGQSFAEIARGLESDRVPTPAGSGRWGRGNVASLVKRLARERT